MRSGISLLASAALLLVSSAAASKPARRLQAECDRVTKVYPLLMLARMGEGPMDCGTSDDGSDYVDCAAGETAEEKAAHARRFAVRKIQEAAYGKADDACTAWRADRASAALREAAVAAIAEARATDRGVLPAGAP
jgi:hypothetical protein